jgi:glycerol kinase
MEADSGIPVKEVRVDGGATINDHLMQFQADMLNTNVLRPRITETTALGAAYLSGLAVGFWNDLEELQSYWEPEKVFQPAMSDSQRTTHKMYWNKAIQAALAWTK